MLNHTLKECPEKAVNKNQAAEECLQYGSWLKGEPLKRNGWGTTQTKLGGNADFSQRTNGAGTKKHAELTHAPNNAKELDRGHMLSPLNLEDSHLWEISMSEALGNLPEVLYENGSVKGEVGKVEEKSTYLDETLAGFATT